MEEKIGIGSLTGSTFSAGPWSATSPREQGSK
jgi:hypothetical protein